MCQLEETHNPFAYAVTNICNDRPMHGINIMQVIFASVCAILKVKE